MSTTVFSRQDRGIREPTPWGVSNSATQFAQGITFYATPSHGGFKLDPDQLNHLHTVHGPVKTFCGQPEWFEEDCDWAYVATAFPQYFSEEELQHARATIQWLAGRGQ